MTYKCENSQMTITAVLVLKKTIQKNDKQQARLSHEMNLSDCVEISIAATMNTV